MPRGVGTPPNALVPAGTGGMGGPSARTGAVLVAVPHSDRLLLFGGCDARQQYGDLFEYRLPSRSGSGRESARHKAAAGEESSRRGSEESSRRGSESSRRAHRDDASSPRTGGGWAMLDVAGVPPAKRSNHSMLPSPDGQRVLIFGGFDGQGFLGDTMVAVLDR